MASILGGAQTPASNNTFKKFTHEVNVALPKPEEMRPINWSKTTITFDPSDQLRWSFMAGKLPMMCTPTISKTLIESAAGINVLSVETFEKLQLSNEQLMPTKPFWEVTMGSTVPIGQVHLRVNVAHIHLPYNAILGYPTLAKFMAGTHHGYNILKMPGSGGSITIACDEKYTVCTVERAHHAAAAEHSDDVLPCEDPCKKKKKLLPMELPGALASVPGGRDHATHRVELRTRRPPWARTRGSHRGGTWPDQ